MYTSNVRSYCTFINMGSFPSWLRRLTVNKLAIATACSNHAYPIHEFPPPSFTKSESKKDLESMRPRAR